MRLRLDPSRMALLLLAAAAVCGVFAWKLRSQPAFLSGPPEVVVHGTGTGGSQSLEFEVKNTGGAVLTLLGSKSSCGCTVPSSPLKSSLMPGETCRIPLSVNVPLHGEEHVQLEILTDSTLTPTVTIPIRLVAGEPKTPILLTMDRSLTLRGSETKARSKNFVVKTLEREGAAPWITSVMVDRQELTAQIVDTSETRMSEHPGVVMRDYVLQARRTDAGADSQSVVCRISVHS